MAKRIVDEEMRFSIIVNGDSAQKELYDLEKTTRDLTQRNKELRAEQAKMVAQGKKQTSEYKALSAEIKQNNTAIQSSKVRMKELQGQIGITGLTMAQLGKKATQLRLQLRNMVPGSAQYKRFNNELKAVNVQLGKLKAQGRATKFSLGGIANSFNKYAALGASVIATITGIIFSVQKLIDFNGKLSDSMSDVQKTTGMTLEEVEDLAKGFGALETRTSRINLLKIAEEGGRIGIAKDEIADFVAIMDKAVVALGDSFPGGAEETAAKLGKLKLLFKETKDQKVDEAYNAIGSAINDLGANGVATEINIANFATRVGSLPDALKPSIADALALGAAFEENGIKAEIAGRAYSILLNQSAKESEKFAEVMGITNDEVKKLINENPLDFLIKFADGLQGMNATDTAKTLEYLGVSADGANKVLGALSNNTERFTELMHLSNDSMVEGTSLINEYNIKNNNFAANLDKLGKYFRGIFVNGPIVSGIKSVVNGLADLLGIADDLNEAFEKETKATAASARANRELADSSAALLDEYQDLTEDGIIPTDAAKERLDEITLILSNRFGESVVEINKETGALKLNTKAVREQIKLKRLAADEEAATLVSRLKGAQDEKARLEELLPEQLNSNAAAGRLRDKAMKEFMANVNSGAAKLSDIKTVEEVDIALTEKRKLYQLNQDIEEQEKRRIDLLEELKKYNFTASDVDLVYGGTDTAVDAAGPDASSSSNRGRSKVPRASSKAKQGKSLLDLQRETEDARLEILKEGVQKELELQRVAHERKVQDLQSRKVTAVAGATEINAEINKQIQIQEELNILKVGGIIEEGVEDRFSKLSEAYEEEKARKQAQHNDELAALGNNEKAKEALDKKFKGEQLQRDEAHLKEVLRKLDEIKSSGYFGGINLDLLTPEQVQQFEKLADDLILKLSEVGLAKAGLSGGSVEGEEPGFDGSGELMGAVDIFGLSAEQWEQTFDSLDTINEKIEAGLMIVGAMATAYGMFSDMSVKKNQAEFQNWEKLQDKKKNTLDKNLEDGLINQRQYDESVRAMEAETARKKWELDYQQAKNDKVQGIANAIINTSVAIMQGYAQLGPIGGTIAAVLMGTLGALQINAIRRTPLPAKGFEDGFYGNMPIRRQQDGKVYNASYGGTPSSQLVNSPKYFLAGEGGKDFPEMIIDGRAFKQFDPNFKNALYNEIARVKGYESGFYQNQTSAPAFNNESSTEQTMALMALVAENTAVLKDLRDNGVPAYLKRSLQTAKQMQEDIKDYESLRNKNKR